MPDKKEKPKYVSKNGRPVYGKRRKSKEAPQKESDAKKGDGCGKD